MSNSEVIASNNRNNGIITNNQTETELHQRRNSKVGTQSEVPPSSQPPQLTPQVSEPEDNQSKPLLGSKGGAPMVTVANEGGGKGESGNDGRLMGYGKKFAHVIKNGRELVFKFYIHCMVVYPALVMALSACISIFLTGLAIGIVGFPMRSDALAGLQDRSDDTVIDIVVWIKIHHALINENLKSTAMLPKPPSEVKCLIEDPNCFQSNYAVKGLNDNLKGVGVYLELLSDDDTSATSLFDRRTLVEYCEFTKALDPIITESGLRRSVKVPLIGSVPLPILSYFSIFNCLKLPDNCSAAYDEILGPSLTNLITECSQFPTAMFNNAKDDCSFERNASNIWPNTTEQPNIRHIRQSSIQIATNNSATKHSMTDSQPSTSASLVPNSRVVPHAKCRSPTAYLLERLLPSHKQKYTKSLSDIKYLKIELPLATLLDSAGNRVANYPTYRALYDKILALGREKLHRTRVAGISAGMLEQLFQQYLVQDLVNVVLALCFIAVCTGIYSRSAYFTLMVLIALCFAIGISYFLYSVVFGIRFFPFINLLSMALIVAIGADDAFVLFKCWTDAEANFKKANELRISRRNMDGVEFQQRESVSNIEIDITNAKNNCQGQNGDPSYVELRSAHCISVGSDDVATTTEVKKLYPTLSQGPAGDNPSCETSHRPMNNGLGNHKSSEGTIDPDKPINSGTKPDVTSLGALKIIASEALAHTIMAMFVTSATTSAALFVNAINGVVVIKCFGVFSGTTIIVTYLFIITWLAAALILYKKHVQGRICSPVEFISKLSAKCLPNRCKNLGSVKFDVFGCVISWVIYKCRWVLFLSFILITIFMTLSAFYWPRLRYPYNKVSRMFVNVEGNAMNNYEANIKHFYAGASGSTEHNGVLSLCWGFKPDALSDLDKFDGTVFGPSLAPDPAYDVTSKHFLNHIGSGTEALLNTSQDGIKLANVDSFWNWPREYLRWADLHKNKSSNGFSLLDGLLQSSVPKDCHETLTPHCAITFFKEHPESSKFGSVLYTTGQNKTVQGLVLSLNLAKEVSFAYTQLETVYEAGNEIKTFYDYSPVILAKPVEVSFFYNLHRGLIRGMERSVLISVFIALFCILFTTRHLLNSIISIVSISCLLVAILGSLALLGWQLKIVESILIILAVGLCFDYTLHYAVAFNVYLIRAENSGAIQTRPNDEVKPNTENFPNGQNLSSSEENFQNSPRNICKDCSLPLRGRSNNGSLVCLRCLTRHTLCYIGAPVLMAAVTSFGAGLFLLQAVTYPFYQMGVFSALVSFISWVYATFFFLPFIIIVYEMCHIVRK